MPNMPAILGERLALEKLVKDSPKSIDPELRQRMLTEPFTLMNAVLESQKQPKIDKPVALGCLGTIVLVAILVAIVRMLPREWKGQSWDDTAFSTILAIGTAYTLVQNFLIPRRYYRQKILPRLCTSLSPLQPEKEELNAILSRFRDKNILVGKRIKLDDLWRELHPLRGDAAA